MTDSAKTTFRVDFQLFAELANPDTRRQASKRLAREMRAEDLLLFDFDLAKSQHLPSLSFPEVFAAHEFPKDLLDLCVEDEIIEATGFDHLGKAIHYAGLKASQGIFVFVNPRAEFALDSEFSLFAKSLSEVLSGERRVRNWTAQKALLDQFAEDLKSTTSLLSHSQAELEKSKKEFEIQQEDLKATCSRRMQAADESVEAANRAKSIFLANMSHEIRTPLGVILGFARLIQDPLSPTEHESYIQAILRNGSLLQQIFNDILDLSRVEAGLLEIEKSTFSIRDLVQDIIDGYGPGAKDKGLSLSLRVDESIPSQLRSDPRALRKILVNLLSNAIKFTAQGSIAVELKIEDDRRLVIDVIDTGIGVDLSERESLFQPFYQADSSNTRRFGGTGLGLALARNLAESLGGELILLSTTVGRGTTFRLSTPVGLSDRRSAQAAKARPAVNLDGKRILLAEDAEDVQMLMKRVLGRLGLNVVIAGDGQAAVDLARAEYFDVVLMDMQMPLKDGLTATRELRDIGYERPIVALTANAFKEDKTLFIEAGCSAYLGKPIEFQKLKATLESQIRLLEGSPSMTLPYPSSHRKDSGRTHEH